MTTFNKFEESKQSNHFYFLCFLFFFLTLFIFSKRKLSGSSGGRSKSVRRPNARSFEIPGLESLVQKSEASLDSVSLDNPKERGSKSKLESPRTGRISRKVSREKKKAEF